MSLKNCSRSELLEAMVASSRAASAYDAAEVRVGVVAELTLDDEDDNDDESWATTSCWRAWEFVSSV